MKTKLRKRRDVQVRESTYERLRELANRNGEQVSTYLDGLIVQWLNEREGN